MAELWGTQKSSCHEYRRLRARRGHVIQYIPLDGRPIGSFRKMYQGEAKHWVIDLKIAFSEREKTVGQ